MDICARFDAVMAKVLHFAGTPEGLLVPWDEVEREIVRLAEVERRQLVANDAMLADLEAGRFAVYAWVDEKMLTSSRTDAHMWASHSLQQRYYNTAAAGSEFYTRLRGLFEAGRQALGDPLPSVFDRPDEELPAFFEHFAEPMDTSLPAVRSGELALAGEKMRVPLGALRLYALCLVYGFKGQWFRLDDGVRLRELRETAHMLLRRTGKTSLPRVLAATSARKAEREGSVLLRVYRLAEPGLFWIMPLVVCAAMYVYCAGVLASLTLPAGQ